MRSSVLLAVCAVLVLLHGAVCCSGQYTEGVDEAYGSYGDAFPYSTWLSNGALPLSLPHALYSPACDSFFVFSSPSLNAKYSGGTTNDSSPASYSVSSYATPNATGAPPAAWKYFSAQSYMLPTGLAKFGTFQAPPMVQVIYGGESSNGVANNSVYLSTDSGASWTHVVQSTPFPARTNMSYTSITATSGSSSKIGFFYGGYGVNGNLYADCWTIDATGQGTLRSQGAIPARGGAGVVSMLNSGGGNTITLSGGRSGNGRTVTYNYLNDVWLSTSMGASWIQLTTAAPWTPRYGHSVWTGQEQDIFLYGGNGAGVGNAEVPLTDLWWGNDLATNFTQLFPANAGFAPAHSIAGCFMSAVIDASSDTKGATLYLYHLANTAGHGAPPSNQSAVLQIVYSAAP